MYVQKAYVCVQNAYVCVTKCLCAYACVILAHHLNVCALQCPVPST